MIKLLPIFQTTNRLFLVEFIFIICIMLAVNIGCVRKSNLFFFNNKICP